MIENPAIHIDVLLVSCDIPKGEINLEELAFELINHVAEDVFEDDENIMIYGSFENFGSLQKELENKEYNILSSGFERTPNINQFLAF